MMMGALLAFVVGLSVGSFLNVVILRTNAGQSLGGRSRCLSCKAEIAPKDLIPLVSFLALRGKCRSCGTPISWQYPLVEFGTGLLFFTFYLRFMFGFGLPGGLAPMQSVAFFLRDLVFVSYLVLLFVYDLKFSLILDRFTVPAMAIAFGLNLWVGTFHPYDLALGGAILGGFFLVQYLFSKGRWIGGGDIRLGVLMGFMLGWKDALGALFIAYALGAAVGLVLIHREKAAWQTQVPFGTFLTLATIVMLLFGKPILAWYSGFFI